MLKFAKDSVLWEASYAGAAGELEEEGAVETSCYELTTIPMSCPSTPARGVDRKTGSKVELGKKGVVK